MYAARLGHYRDEVRVAQGVPLLACLSVLMTARIADAFCSSLIAFLCFYL